MFTLMLSNLDKARKYVLFLFNLWSKMLIILTHSKSKIFPSLAFSKSLVLCDGSKMINFVYIYIF